MDGRRVMLIDTPGFNGTNVTDERLLEWIAEWLLGMTDPELQLNGIIILQPVENPRVLGTEKRMIQLLEAIIGPRFLSHVVVGFTMCDKGQSEDIKQSVEGRLATQYWGHLTSNGNVKCLQKDRPDLYPDTVRPLLQKEKALLLMQSELQTTDGSLFGTSAGQFLGRRLARYSARDTNASNELAASQATLRTTNSIAPMPLPINTSVTPQRIRNPNQPYNLSLRPSQSLAYHPNYSIQSSLGPPPIRSAITQPQAAPMGAGIPTQGPQRIQDVLKDLPRLLGLPVTHNGPKPHSRRALNNTTYLGSRSYNPLPNYPYPRNDFKNPTRYESRTDDNHAVSRRPSPGHSYDVDDSESDNDIEDKPTPEEARIRLQELQQMTVKVCLFLSAHVSLLIPM